LIVIIMEGFEAMSIITCIAAFILMLWSGKSMKVKGGYIETMCNIEFQRGRIKWQYPSIDLQDGNGAASVVYYIYENEIKSILLSQEIRSLRIECCPVAEYHDKAGNTKSIDYGKMNKNCVLIMYNCELKRIQDLINQYIKVDIEFVD
jgi:hypothetical protein